MRSITLSTVILVLLAVLSCTEEAQTGMPEQNDSVLSNQKASDSSDQGAYFIDLKEAEALSSQFMNWNRENGQTLRSGSREENPLLNAMVVRSDEMDTLMYVINYRRGFAIVSATKGVFPILAYSDEDNFDASELEDMENNENIGLSIWWDLTKKSIIEAKEKVSSDPDRTMTLDSYAAFKKVLTEGNKATLRSTREGKYYNEIRNYKKVGPLLTTNWHQGEPFNNHTPIKDGKHAPAGCVPVAIAQVVYYYKRLDGENIAWGNIKDNGANAADLIQVISKNIKMCYTSGYAYPSIEVPNFFHYRARIEKYLNAKGYNTQFVDAKGAPATCPAIYEGFKGNFVGTPDWFKGHWWVVDGYESYDVYQGWGEMPEKSLPHRGNNPPYHGKLTCYGVLFLHFNWGWGDKVKEKIGNTEIKYNSWYGVSNSYEGYSKSLKVLNITPK